MVKYFPIDETNTLLSWDREGVTKLPAEPFDGVLEYIKREQGKINRLFLKDIKTGITYTMGETSFFNNIHLMCNGYMIGKFVVKKIGKVFSLAVVKQEQPVVYKEKKVYVTKTRIKEVKVPVVKEVKVKVPVIKEVKVPVIKEVKVPVIKEVKVKVPVVKEVKVKVPVVKIVKVKRKPRPKKPTKPKVKVKKVSSLPPIEPLLRRKPIDKQEKPLLCLLPEKQEPVEVKEVPVQVKPATLSDVKNIQKKMSISYLSENFEKDFDENS